MENNSIRELSMEEIEQVNGGISGYAGAGAVLGVLGTGMAISGAVLISAPVIGIALGVAGGLAMAQFFSNLS